VSQHNIAAPCSNHLNTVHPGGFRPEFLNIVLQKEKRNFNLPTPKKDVAGSYTHSRVSVCVTARNILSNWSFHI
jgi:hypothetical protein